jgi:hypothetical protein
MRFGASGLPWTAASPVLHGRKLIDAATQSAIDELRQFGRLIASTDRHDGNLSFRPGPALAPAYDMLPMLYAPVRGVALPPRHFSPQLPQPAERQVWTAAAVAAQDFWLHA